MSSIRDFRYVDQLKCFHSIIVGKQQRSALVLPHDKKDEKLLKNICKYYKKRLKTESFNDESVKSYTWVVLLRQHEKFSEELINEDIDALHERLRVFCSDEISIGIGDSTVMFRENIIEKDYLLNNVPLRDVYTFGVFDKLLSVAEAAGVIKHYNPEDVNYDKIMQLNPEPILDGLASWYKADLSAPRCAGGTVGLETKYGVYTQRDMYAMHLALTIADKYKDKDINICEIGGGMGHLAFYLSRLGYKNISIVDLPTVSAIQYYFLANNLGIDNGVKLLGPKEFTGKYDLVVNMDSFIEMKRETAKEYIDLIDKNTKNLISVNQETGEQFGEDGFKVSDLTTMTRVNRQQSWVRKGWIFEEYVSNNHV